MKKRIVPYFFEGFLLISLSPKWIKAFDGVPNFEWKIGEDKRLYLISDKEITNPET